jgi:hypothetical protein
VASKILAKASAVNADLKRKLGTGLGNLAEKMATHHLVVRKKLNVKQKPREPTAEEMWEAYEKARKDIGIIWCWMLRELGMAPKNKDRGIS